MITTVVFDMDGVLFDTEKIYKKASMKVAEKYGLQNMKKVADACTGLNDAGCAKVFEEEYGSSIMTYSEFIEERMIFYREITKDGIPEKPYLHEILDFLKENGIRTALATSTRRKIAMEHLESAGIEKYFNVIITGDMVKRGKPAPDIYATACVLTGSVPEESIAVEDSFNGIRSAYAAGLRPVMVPDLYEPTEEISKMLYGCCTTLGDVIGLIKKEIKKPDL